MAGKRKTAYAQRASRQVTQQLHLFLEGLEVAQLRIALPLVCNISSRSL